MRKLFFMLIILFILYLGIQFAFYWFSGGQDNIYDIITNGETFEINEVSNFSYEVNMYNYNITVNDTVYSFKIFKNYNKDSQVLQSIKYYKDNSYECILPIFKDGEILIDMICKNDDNFNYYFNIKGQNENLDKFMNNIEEYDINQFTDTASKQAKEGIYIFSDNLLDNHYISFNNYRGLYIVSERFNNSVYNISLFNKDVYKQSLGQFVDKYYVIPDYDSEHEFSKIEVVNFVNLDTTTISFNNKISFDSYIQGVVDGKIYLFDKDDAVQYEIDPANESVVRLSNNEIKYYDGEWKTMTVAEAKAEKKFITNNVDYADEQYIKIDKVGQDDGYYYLYKKNGNKYDVYRMNSKDHTGLIYLFTTNNINYMRYIGDYVYFIDDDLVKVYNDRFGVKKLVEYTELNFNNEINFNVYAIEW